MKNRKYGSPMPFTFLALLSVVVGCNNNASNPNAKSTEVADANSHQKSCYLFTEEHTPIIEGRDTLLSMVDSTILNIVIDEGKVSGIFENKPAEKDAMIGTITGRKRGSGLINASYIYRQEGENYTQLIQIMVTESKAHLRFVNDTNELVGPVTGIEWLTLPKVNCKPE